MTNLAIHECLIGFARETSANWSSSEFNQALGFYLQGKQQDALGILDSLENARLRRDLSEEMLEISQMRVSCYLAIGDLSRARELAQALVKVCDDALNERWLGLALLSAALVAVHEGHSRYSADLGIRAKGLLARSGDSIDIARACSAVGYASVLAGEYQIAQRELETAANLSEIARSPVFQATACRRLAFLHLKRGRFASAIEAFTEALGIYEAIGASWSVAQLNFNLASVYCHLGEVAPAEKLLSEAIPPDAIGGSGLALTRTQLLRAWLLILKSEEREAIDLLDEILPKFRENNAQRDEALCHEFLGDAYRGLGEFDRAQEHYNRGLEKGRMVSVTSDVVLECLRKTAELELEKGKTAQSLVALRRAIKLARKTGDKFELACLIRLRGRLKHARGQRSAASQYLEAAWNDFRTMGASVEASRTAGVMSTQLRMEGKVEEARVWTRLAGGRAAPEGADMRGIPRGRKLSKDLRSTALKARESGIVTSDPRILKSFQLAVRAAGSHLPALILGETGSGKELFASTIHAYSQNRGSFIPVNCAALPADILDAELFGHSRGAFTGAFRDRAGLIESATGGTLFLDEIGEMALPVQGRLLRAIELGEIRRLGESTPRKVATRFVAATHRDLEEMVRKGTFRADLFFRLKGVIIPVPPLRERSWDVDILVDNFMATMSQKYRRAVTLTDGARERLRSHPWPGNVRELKSVIERLVSMNDNGEVIDVYDLGIGEIQYSISLEEHLEQEEKSRLTAILESVQWNKSAAARILKLKRTTLLGKLKRLGIQVPPRK